MTARDRLVVCVLLAGSVLAALWLGVVSPKRSEAARLGKQVTVQQARLAAARGQLAQGVAAQVSYQQNLHVVAQLYRAVPASDGVPKLLIALDRSSQTKHVDFRVISVQSTASAGAPPATTTAAAGAAPVPGGLQPLAFTFTFNGGYIALQHFLRSVAHYTLTDGNAVVAHGRLLVLQSVALSPLKGGGTRASVTATAYSQPAAGSPTATQAPAPAAAAAPPSASSPQPVTDPTIGPPAPPKGKITP